MACAYDRTGTDCSGKPQPGTVALQTYLLDRFDARQLGIYNCRNSRGGSRLSEHAEGRAGDVGLLVSRPDERLRGDELAELLVAHHVELGVQSVVWNRRVWGFGRCEWRPYFGVNPHVDHVHWGHTWQAARTLTTERIIEVLEEDTMPGLYIPTNDPNDAPHSGWLVDGKNQPLRAIGDAPPVNVLGGVQYVGQREVLGIGPDGADDWRRYDFGPDRRLVEAVSAATVEAMREAGLLADTTEADADVFAEALIGKVMQRLQRAHAPD